MSCLNLDLDYFTHPKTVRLVGLLGRGAEVLPIKLWCYCGKYHSESGKLTGYSAQEIESAIGWWGKVGELIEIMVRIGFLDFDGKDYIVHDWIKHEGHLKMFHIRAQQAAAKRWGLDSANATSNATSNAQGELKQCPKPNQTLPYQTKPTKPEKQLLPAPQADAEAQNPKAEKAEWLVKFENWWCIYPPRKGVKCGKQAAKEAFLRVITSPEAYNNLIAATNAYKGSRQLQELDCAKDAERFLKKDYWKDWIPKPAPARAAEPKVLSPREEAEKKEPNFCDKCNHRGLLFREPGEKDWHAADCDNKDFLRYIQKYSENKRCECNPE
jgi:hypothetical protein